MSDERQPATAEPDDGEGGGHSLCDLSKPVLLSRDYLRRVALLEALPENQSGADKTWVEEMEREHREFYAKVRRVTR